VGRGALPEGTVTFVFTDVEGSTRLLHELGAEAYAQELSAHRRALRDAFAQHGGVEVDTQGDAFFYAFPDAAGALAGAEQGRHALAAGRIRVRMGLHTGTPHLGEEGYVGEDVHLGARIAACGHGGQVLVSKATRDLVGDGLADLGEHRLKDFGEPVWIFQLGSERFPPLKTISNTNLPRPVSMFVGRDQERAELRTMLLDGSRLVTLSGPGGTGKTRLAVEVATGLVPEFRNGVYWVGLAALRDPALVIETIAQTLGAKDDLVDHIGERELLLLLDNFEQVVEAAPDLSPLLAGCPNLRVLVTSRELLRLQGEREYAVLPLDEQDAVTLFCDRSGLEPNVTINKLCARLDELPLAIELAAARSSVLSPAQILARLSKRLDLLKGGRDGDARQHTLRATIEWSHDLLDAREQRLFAGLAVFAGGCTLDAAEHVCDADLDTLQSLVDKSLLRHTGERFWMLETTRQFAEERLATQSEWRRRHLWYFLRFAEQTELPGGVPRWTVVASEHDNLRAALEWASAADEGEALLRLVAALADLWSVRGFFDEARRWYPLALERASTPLEARVRALHVATADCTRRDELDAAAAWSAKYLAAAEQLGDNREVLLAMNDAAHLALKRGDLEDARARWVEIGELAARFGDKQLRAFSTINLSLVAGRSGDERSSLDYATEAAGLFRELENESGLNVALINSGYAAFQLGDVPLAERAFREGLAIADRLWLAPRIGLLAVGMAAVLVRRGEHERAAMYLGAGAAVREEVGIGFEDEEERQLHDEAFAAAKLALGEDALAAAWASGHAMTPDQMHRLWADS
jgi:predicted ATPase